MAPCCQHFVYSTAACDTAVNRGIRFHVETLHIIPFEACSYLLCIRDLPSRTMLSSWSFLVSFSRTEPLFVPIFKVFLDCWSQLPDLVSLSATAVSHFSCALLPYQPFPNEWSLLSLPETRAYAAGASAFFA